MPKRRKYIKEDLEEIVQNNISVRGVLSDLGIVPAGGNYKTIQKKIQEFNIDTSHFLGQGYLRGKSHSFSKKIPLSEILVENSSYTSTSHLKNRLLKDNLFDYKCSECSISDWNGKPLSLHLDHINGINDDHRFDNLRLLCPNCHSQTPTWTGKNIGAYAPYVKNKGFKSDTTGA